MEQKILLFNKWDLSEVKVSDLGLNKYINLNPIIAPRTFGRFGTRSFHKTNINVVERFINKLAVPGHAGKRHKLTSKHCCGSFQELHKVTKQAFEIIQEKTKKNPVQILISAIENAALYEEIAAYQLGGIIARKAVITSPQRRLDVALRLIAQGIYKSSFKSKSKLAEVIANVLILTANNDTKSFAIRERNRIEKEAEGAR